MTDTTQTEAMAVPTAGPIDLNPQVTLANIHTRICGIHISNPYYPDPADMNLTANFILEDIVSLGNGRITRMDAGSATLSVTANNLDDTFALLNPYTHEKMGDFTYGQLFAIIYSLSIKVTEDKAKALAAAQEPTVKD